jgi:hypothetical protein
VANIQELMKRRIQAMNDVFGIEPEQIKAGLTPLDVISATGRTVDAFTGAPTRAAIGAAITGENPLTAASQQFGANPDVAPSFGTVEDIVLDPSLVISPTKMGTRMAALSELGAVGKDISSIQKSPGFYSKLLETVKEKMGGSATPEQIRGMLKEVKPEEYSWLGVEDYLSGLQRKANETQGDLIRGDRSIFDASALLEDINVGNAPVKVSKPEFLSYLSEKVPDIEKNILNKTKYEEYTIPGGDKYKEILFTVPESKASVLEKKIQDLDFKISSYKTNAGIMRDIRENPTGDLAEKLNYLELMKEDAYKQFNAAVGSKAIQGSFKSRHFDEPNVLAHARVNDRVAPDGSKVLFAEEIQSDWHQAGRKEGYGPKIEKQVTAEVNGMPIGYGKTQEEALINADQGWLKLAERGVVEIKYNEQNRVIGHGVPNAPLKKTWHEYIMKNLIKDAVEGGYDKVAWTTGEQQAKRYDLSKHIDAITITKNHDGTFGVAAFKDQAAMGRGRNPLIEITHLSKSELSETIGKELADRAEKEINPESGSNFKKYNGIDLQIGGEGMKGFYDKILVDYAKKFGKKYGANVGKTTINDESVHYLQITPKMKEEILKKGLPLFAAPAAMRLKAMDND